MGNRCCNYQEPELSPEQEAKIVEIKKPLLEKYRYTALVTIVAGFTSLVVGIAIIPLGYKGGFPVTSGSPIWTGFMLFVGACLGLAGTLISADDKSPERRKKQYQLIGVYNGLSFYGFCIGLGQSMGYIGWSLGQCAQKDPNSEKCPENHESLIALNAVALACAVIMFICSIFVWGMYWSFNKKYRQIVNNQQTGCLTSGTKPPSYDQSMSTNKF